MTDFREQTVLGRTGLPVGRLGVGAGYGVPAHALEKAFYEYGVNYFYWGSSRKPGMREAIRNLSTTNRNGLAVVLQSFAPTGLLVRSSVDKALRVLGIDYADVLILGFRFVAPRGGLLKTALDLKDQGKVRFLGLSSHRRSLYPELARWPDNPIDVFMVPYNAANLRVESDLFPHLPAETPPGITAFLVTRWGSLLNPRKMPSGERPLTAADCYRFALSNPHVDVCITGPRTAEELTANLKALEEAPLTEEELERIRRIGDHFNR
jgi:aryl-alcohol dehydrogenase-like predicted oxidoreductase